VAPTLVPGDRLHARRQPGNRYDSLAIELFAPDLRKLRYIPRDRNPPYARLMDAGAEIVVTVKRVLDSGYWLDIDTSIAVEVVAGDEGLAPRVV